MHAIKDWSGDPTDGNSLFHDHPVGKCPLIGGKCSHVQTPCKVIFCFVNVSVIQKSCNIWIYISLEKNNKS